MTYHRFSLRPTAKPTPASSRWLTNCIKLPRWTKFFFTRGFTKPFKCVYNEETRQENFDFGLTGENEPLELRIRRMLVGRRIRHSGKDSSRFDARSNGGRFGPHYGCRQRETYSSVFRFGSRTAQPYTTRGTSYSNRFFCF